MRIRKYPINTYTVKQLAYLAGIFDGEGHFGVGYSKTGNIYTILFVTSSDKVLMDWLVLNFSGSYSQAARRQDDKSRRYQWRFPCGKEIMKNLLEQLIPFLVIKNQEAVKVQEVVTHKFTLNRSLINLKDTSYRDYGKALIKNYKEASLARRNDARFKEHQIV